MASELNSDRDRMHQRLHALAHASRAFSAATSDYRRLLDVVSSTVGGILGDVCSIRLISRDGRLKGEDASVYHERPEVAEAFRRAITQTSKAAGEGLAGRVTSSGQPLIIEFPKREDLLSHTLPEYRALLEVVDIGAVVLFPLMSHERCLGVLTLGRERPRPPFDADDLQLAQDLADRAALALENSTLLVQLGERVDELGKAEERFRQLLELAPDALVLTDGDGRMVLVNAQTEQLFGHARSDLLGQSIERLLLAAEGAPHPLLAFAGSEPAQSTASALELTGLRKDGSSVDVEVKLSPLRLGSERLVSALIRDVSERKRLEAVKARARELEAENTRAHEASRLKSEFLANMSHELRTPLNAIIGFSTVLHAGKAGPLTPQQTEYLGDVVSSARQLLQLISDVLELAKIEAGRLVVRPEPVDLAGLVAEVRSTLQAQASEKGVVVRVDVAPAVERLVTDPQLFRQVLYNYLSNAIKFSSAQGYVLVSVEPASPERFRLRVRDSGIGIKQADMDQLFQHFRQLSAGSTKRHPGAGLGLALARHAVEAQGGEVWAESVLGQGSTFFAELPLRRPGSSAK